MGIYGVLCTLSPKRRAQLQSEPGLLEELISARHDDSIPGLLDVGKAWDALSRMLGGADRKHAAADAVLGRTGRAFGPRLSFGPARVLEPEDVARIATALPEDVEGHVEKTYPTLAGSDVHGGYGREGADKAHELKSLSLTLRKVVDLYRKAAKDGHAMLVAIV